MPCEMSTAGSGSDHGSLLWLRSVNYWLKTIIIIINIILSEIRDHPVNSLVCWPFSSSTVNILYSNRLYTLTSYKSVILYFWKFVSLFYCHQQMQLVMLSVASVCLCVSVCLSCLCSNCWKPWPRKFISANTRTSMRRTLCPWRSDAVCLIASLGSSTFPLPV